MPEDLARVQVEQSAALAQHIPFESEFRIVHGDEATEADLAAMNADAGSVRGRLAEVGVALGSDVKASVFAAANTYREMATTSHRSRDNI